MFPEREKKPQVPEGVGVIEPESKVLPDTLAEETGIKQVETALRANVKIGGTQVMQTPQNQAVTITLPTDPQTLTTQVKKGNIVDAATWLAAFWLRMFKKALHFSWNVVIGRRENQ